MASNSGRKYGSSDRSTRKRVVIGAEETVRVRYDKNQPRVESERRSTARQTQRVASKRAGVSSRPAERAGKRLATSKRDARARRQTEIRLRRGALALVAAGAVAMLCWGLVALYNAPVWTVRQVEVEGSRHISPAGIRALARIPEDATLLRLPQAEIEQRIEADPWVAEATVERDFPSTVRIRVRERRAGAVVDLGGADLWVVSADAVWLSQRSKEDTGLVVVRDVEGAVPKAGKPAASREISNALRVIAGLSPTLRKQVRVVSAPSVDQTALVTESDVEIFVGSAERISDKDRIAREILKREKGKVVYINVRVVDHPTWRGL